MDGRTVVANGQNDVHADFRRVMASVTEQACASGRELEVMEALFPVILGVDDHDGPLWVGFLFAPTAALIMTVT